MEWGDSASGSKPSIDGDVIFLSFTKTTVVRNTNVFFQLRDLKFKTVISYDNQVPSLRIEDIDL